jgi:hypothetical protein
MGFTVTSRNALKSRSKGVVFRLRLRTEHPESNTFAEITLAENGFRLTREIGLPAMLEFELLPPPDGFGAENDPANRVQLFARCELWCDVYSGVGVFETERLFDGIVTELTPSDGTMRGTALDRLHALARTVCAVSRDAATIAVSDGAPLAPADGFDDHTYGLDIAETPDGFSPLGARRAWQPGDIRAYNPNGNEAPPGAYVVYPDSGVVRFNAIPQGAFTVSCVRCYVEGTNDAASVLESALTYPREFGGAGIADGELELNPLGIDINRVRWDETDGSTMDFVAYLKKTLPSNVVLSYDSAVGVFKLEKLVQKAEPDLTLMNPIRVDAPRDTHGIYTRIVVTGAETSPTPLTDNAQLTDLLGGDGEVYRWDGNRRIVGEGTIALISDGNANSGFGRHNLSGEPYAWRDFALFDLGEPPSGGQYRISRVDVVAANSHNPNSQSGANQIFLYGVDLLGSADGVEFVRIAPDAKMYLKPLEVRVIESPTFDRFRYLKVRVKPAKDGLSNQNDPGCALNEIRVYGSMRFTAEVAVQGDDPQDDFYFPALLEKTAGIGHLTYLEDTGDALDRYKALERAGILLNEFIRSFQRIEYACVVDPMLDAGMTAAVNDALTGVVTGVLVERVVIEQTKTSVTGVDYLAAPCE